MSVVRIALLFLGLGIPLTFSAWVERTSAGSPGRQYWLGIASSSDGTRLGATVYNGYMYTTIADTEPTPQPTLGPATKTFDSFTLQASASPSASPGCTSGALVALSEVAFYMGEDMGEDMGEGDDSSRVPTSSFSFVMSSLGGEGLAGSNCNDGSLSTLCSTAAGDPRPSLYIAPTASAISVTHFKIFNAPSCQDRIVNAAITLSLRGVVVWSLSVPATAASVFTFTVPAVPTPLPTLQPTLAPTLAPSHTPSSRPTQSPTPLPTLQPTQPSPEPTAVPTFDPTAQPSAWPTQPSPEPTAAPTQPTPEPTASPTHPTPEPTAAPTQPTPVPTQQPTPASLVASLSFEIRGVSLAQVDTAGFRLGVRLAVSRSTTPNLELSGLGEVALSAVALTSDRKDKGGRGRILQSSGVTAATIDVFSSAVPGAAAGSRSAVGASTLGALQTITPAGLTASLRINTAIQALEAANIAVVLPPTPVPTPRPSEAPLPKPAPAALPLLAVVGACFIGLVLFLAGLAINLYRRWAGTNECETCGKMSLLVLSIVVLLATAFALSLAEIIAQGKLPTVVDGAWAGQWKSTQFATPAGIVVIASAAGLLIVAAIGINLLYQRWCGRWSRYAKVDDRRSHSHSQDGRSRALLPVAAKAQVVTTAGTWGEARVVPI